MLAGKIGYFRASFDPRSISGLAIWLDATEASTLFQDSAATVPATAGQPVGAWRNRASVGGSFTQTTNALRPTYTAAFQNSRPAVVSDGSTTWLSATPSSVGIGALGAATAFFVYRRTGGGNTAWDFGTNASTSINAGNTSLFDDVFRTTRTPGAFVGVNVGITTVAAPASNAARGYRVNGAQMPFTDSQFFAVPATAYIGGGPAFPSGFASFGGGICESLVYDRALSAAEISTVELYLSDKWGITLAPTASNADAQSWINRVYANGGTVSTATATAVNNFCAAIDAAGIRDRFLRLNLLAGNSIAAALVPLYRGQSLGGTQVGNATDTNFNFVAGDYAETGSSGGLLGNGSNKQLSIGLTPDGIGATTGHVSAYIPTVTGTTVARIIGAGTISPTSGYWLGRLSGTSTLEGLYGDSARAVQVPRQSGHYMVSRDSLSSLTMYENGSVASTNTNTANSRTSSFDIRVFTYNFSNSITNFWPSRILSYSVGASMTTTQASAYYTALQAFQTALGRNV